MDDYACLTGMDWVGSNHVLFHGGIHLEGLKKIMKIQT
jgi:hypothetical protein